MMFDVKKLVPHAIALVIFLVISLIYCKPVLEGKVLNAHDNQGWKGMAQQSIEVKEKTGKVPLWTNSLFSGMPGYQVAMENSHKVSFHYVGKVLTLGLPKPANFFFLACLGFYLLALVLGANTWVAVLGALSYAFSTYNPIIIGAGHDTKMLALGYAPIIVAGLLLLFQKRFWLGSAAMATGFTLQLSTSHIQIVYYTLIILAAITLGFVIESIRTKTVGAAVKAIGVAALCGMLALGSNAVITLMNWDYSKASMRGGISELKTTTDKNTTAGGLDKDYAFKYSVGLAETFTLFVPGLYGGSNGGDEYKTSKFADKLVEVGYPEDQALQYANGISYWGDQQPTSGPVYFGAVLMLLFLVGLFLEKGWLKWSLLGAGLFGILLAWGKNAEIINYFLFDYMPLYKKFRAPSMGLVIPQLTFVMLATLGIQKLLFGKLDAAELKKALKQTGIAVALIGILLAVIYFSFDFISPNDRSIRENMSSAMLQQMSRGQQPTADMQQQADSFGREFTAAIQADRKSLLGGDLLRTLFFMLIAGAVVWAAAQRKAKAVAAAIVLAALSFLDLVSVDKRYLNTNNFVDAGDFDNSFAMTEADQQIKQDKGYYRVFNQTGDPFNESLTSYHHNSIGGYHPAKLQIYQDLIENQIAKNNMQVMNMLNTKYFILPNPQTGKPVAQVNPGAFGACWLVKDVQFVADGKAEMAALDSINLRDTAVVQIKFKNDVTLPVADSAASIRLIENKNDIINYESQSATPQFAVFSEIWYDRGWKAFVDGKQVPIIKTNYALRGLSLPAGTHKIEFRFEPDMYSTGNTLVLICSLLTYALVLGGLFMHIRSGKHNA
jgi:hypothetical protein